MLLEYDFETRMVDLVRVLEKMRGRIGSRSLIEESDDVAKCAGCQFNDSVINGELFSSRLRDSVEMQIRALTSIMSNRL